VATVPTATRPPQQTIELIERGAYAGNGVQSGPCRAEHRGSCLRGADRPRRSIEQLVSQLALEPTDLGADARLRDVQLFRGAREAGGLDHREQVGDLTKFHKHPF